MKKSMIYTGLLGSALLLFTGCGMSGTHPTPQPKIETDLKVHYNSSNKKFDTITNGDTYLGFYLENYQPFGFDMKIKGDKIGLVPLFGLITLSGVDDKRYGGVYRKSYCGNDFKDIANNFMNIGTIAFLSLVCGGAYGFDYPTFYKDAKASVNEKEREEIIKYYNGFLNEYNSCKSDINKLVTNYHNKFITIKNSYLNGYNASNVNITNSIKDQTGLYNNELNDNKKYIRVSKNSTYYSLPLNFDKYSRDVTCAIKDCKNIFNNKKQELITNCSITKENIVKQSKLNLDIANKHYKEIISYYNIKLPYYTLNRTFKKGAVEKTLSFDIEASNKVYSNNPILKSIYTIKSVSFKDAYPEFTHSNEDLSITLRQTDKQLSFDNLTTSFIQIKTISIYMNGKVYPLTKSKTDNQISMELAPKTEMKSYISSNYRGVMNHQNFWTSLVPEYNNLTKSKAQKENITFGLAIKYTKGNNNQDKTFYFNKTFNLYDVVKGI